LGELGRSFIVLDLHSINIRVYFRDDDKVWSEVFVVYSNNSLQNDSVAQPNISAQSIFFELS